MMYVDYEPLSETVEVLFSVKELKSLRDLFLDTKTWTFDTDKKMKAEQVAEILGKAGETAARLKLKNGCPLVNS